MNKNIKPMLSGASVAFAAAALAGCSATAATNDTASADANTVDKVHCYGVNVCKGHNDCGGADNACAGQGSCKGTGFVLMGAKACADVGGKAS